MEKPRVMYILNQYPQISETYMQTEIEAVSDEYEVSVISVYETDLAYQHHIPFRQISDPAAIREAVEEFRPHILHSHWILDHTQILVDIARKMNVPFTIRTHSFDVLWKSVPSEVSESKAAFNDDLCLGILAFPFAVPRLEQAGIRPEKLHACYPVVNFQRFLDRSPNGDAVMNNGACLPKKEMGDFLSLAATMPGVEFNLYALGYIVEELKQKNEAMGRPVNIIPPVEPRDMLREYKKHRWLVLTANRALSTIGWSVCVAEAQAAGVGVCAPNLRPDMREYVGDCGFIYDSLDEVREIISKPFPEEMRQMGFEHAKKSDIQSHKTILTDLWRKVVPAQEAKLDNGHL